MSSPTRNTGDFTEAELKKAVALFYDGKQAPTVTAKGTGSQAQEIIDVARQHGVPLCDNPALVDLLVTLELGENIPETLYLAVAHIIAFAWELQGKAPAGFVPPQPT